MNKIYRLLPKNVRSQIAKLNHLISDKPKILVDNVSKQKFPNGAKGGVIISTDFELGWAVRYSKFDKDPELFSKEERKNVPIILDLLEKYQISISWATVGHLFLDSCKKGSHDWMARLPYFDDHWKYISGDWFDCDPYGQWDENLAWYAPDLVRKIIDCKVYQELSCHTFSHIDCSYKNCPQQVIDDELKACSDIAETWGIKFKTLTFPGGTAGNYETLMKYGIMMCRQRIKGYDAGYPYRNNNGILVTPTGPCIALSYDNWSVEYQIKRYKSAIDKMIKKESLIHFWFHPSQEEITFTKVLPEILKYMRKKIDEGELWVGTMGQLNDYINENKVV